MPLTPEQKTKIETILERLSVKVQTYADQMDAMKDVIRCGDFISQDSPTDRELGTAVDATRIEALRVHVVTKGNMLAPAE